MRSATWVRIAAGLTLFQALGHTFGAVLAPSHGFGEDTLRAAMRGYHITAMGMERSYWELYHGSLWSITAVLVMSAGIMWSLAPIVSATPSTAKPVLLWLALGYVSATVIAGLYFVTAPIVVAALITFCLVMSFLRAGAPSAS